MDAHHADLVSHWEGIAARREAAGDEEGARQARLSADTFRAVGKGLASKRHHW